VCGILGWLGLSALLALVSAPVVALVDLLVITVNPNSVTPSDAGAPVLSVLLIFLAASVLAMVQAPVLAFGIRAIRLLGPARAFRTLVTGLVALPLLGIVWWIQAPGLDRVTDPDLRVMLQVVFVLASAAGSIVAGVVVASLIESRQDGASRLRDAGLAAGGLGVAFAAIFVAALWSRFYRELIDAVPLAALTLFGLCEAGVVLAVTALPAVSSWARRLLAVNSFRIVLLLAPVAFFMLAEGVSRIDPDAAPWVGSSNGAAGRVQSILRGIWDFDGDGSSPILGGGDCDDDDPQVSPLAVDEPGNGIDEDCSGDDAEVASAAAMKTYFKEPQDGKRYNVLLVCIDAMRADRVSFLGYPRRTTPRLEVLSRDSWLFDNVIAPSSTTRESIPPLFTGRYPSGVQWEREAKVRPLAASQRLLAEVLKGRGWQTLGVIDEWLKKFLPSSLRGFDIAEVAYGNGRWNEVGQQAAPFTLFRAVELLGARDKSKPFFMYVHMEAPHFPYVRHEDIPSFGSLPSDLYDHEIAYADHYVGLLIEYLETERLKDDTIIIVFGDHGEEFGERGGKQHSRTLYAESIRVPLLVRIPGRRHMRIKTRVSLIDVFPTLMDVLGLRPDEPQPQGFSLFQYTRGSDPWPDRPIFSELMINNEGALRYRKAVYRGNFKLLWDMSSGLTELYDVVQDPKEMSPIDDPEVQDSLLELLKDFVARGDHHG
jgi:arylsulfatase A-like enzyme